MQLPSESSNYKVFARYGRYVAARLRADRRIEWAEDVASAGELVKTKGRAWEDAAEDEASKIGDRDAADDAMDTLAREVRLELASREIGADKKPPYTAIFPEGIGHFTAAPVAQNAGRYREFIARVQSNLPQSDPARTRVDAELPARIESYELATRALETSRITQGVARTALEAEIDAWSVQIERTYGSLVAELGRRKAERYFPGRSSTPDANDGTPQE